MRERLVWFYNHDCEYCVEMEDEVKKFAEKKGYIFTPIEASVIDPETGEPGVPGLMLTNSRLENHIFIGRFCLDALRYNLEGDG